MTDPLSLSDDEFLQAFLDCSISPAGFDHRGHLRIAWLMLNRYPLSQAVEETCRGINRLADHLGVPQKYHRTLSEALVRLMADSGQHTNFEVFMQNNQPLVTDARGVLARHYSDELLATDVARERFVPPDRLPLPL